ncbi:Spy/CpxP family protein refolding chaperone [Nitrospinae bacterium]|nr:Spy/CpxP family protein refolding chaperone [Nitrospinota bacterium]
MFDLKIRHLTALTAIATLLFSQNALAATGINSIGSGSSGSYAHGESEGEVNKSKISPHHISGSKAHSKPEGSQSKSYSHGKNGQGKNSHAYKGDYGKSNSHKKSEGSRSKSYSHGKKGHGKSSHAYKGGYGKSHGQKKSEGSQSKSYSHGKKGHGKSSHAYKGDYGKSHGHKKGSHGGHGTSPFTHVLDYKYQLNLSDLQINKMKEFDLDFKKKIIQAKADHEIAHMELDLQVHSGKVDEAKIRAAGKKIIASKTNKIMAMIDAKINLLKLLTADQRQKMAKMH